MPINQYIENGKGKKKACYLFVLLFLYVTKKVSRHFVPLDERAQDCKKAAAKGTTSEGWSPGPSGKSEGRRAQKNRATA